MAKLNFQQPLLQSSVSHNPSEIILICSFGAQETFIFIIMNVENSCASHFCENHNTFIWDSSINRKFNRTAFILK